MVFILFLIFKSRVIKLVESHTLSSPEIKGRTDSEAGHLGCERTVALVYDLFCPWWSVTTAIWMRKKAWTKKGDQTNTVKSLHVTRTIASASVLPMNIQAWFPLGLIGLILQSKGLSRVFSSTTVQKHQFFSAQPSLWSNSHIHTWPLEKP